MHTERVHAWLIVSALAVTCGGAAEAQPPGPSRGEPYAIGPAYALREVSLPMPRERSIGPGPAAILSDDASTLLFVNGRRTAVMRIGQRRRVLQTPRVYRGDVSPDSRRLVTSTEEGLVTVFDATTGARLTSWTLPFSLRGGDVAFADDDTIYYHSGCALRRMSASGGEPVVIGPTYCDESGFVTDGPRVSLAERARYVIVGVVDQSRTYYADATLYTDIQIFDTRTGHMRLRVQGTSALEVRDARLTSAGDRLCFRSQHQALYCTTGGPPELVARDLHRRYMYFDPSGTKILFVTAGPSGDTTLNLADFTTRTVRRLANTTRESFTFSVDGSILYGWSGPNPNGLDVWDLAEGTHAALYANVEVDYVRGMPGGPRSFMLARARGESNVLSFAELPQGPR